MEFSRKRALEAELHGRVQTEVAGAPARSLRAVSTGSGPGRGQPPVRGHRPSRRVHRISASPGARRRLRWPV
jgi:hypothetical protein